MNRLKLGFGTLLLFAILVAGVMAFTPQSTRAVTSTKPPHVPDPSSMFQGGNPYLPGGTAISPHASANNAPGAAFSQQDVIDFLNKYPVPTTNGTPSKILSIQFVTAKQASDLMKGESVGRPDNYLVCYVKLQGPFPSGSVHLPPGASLPGKDATWGDMVFDASTGNILVWGLYP
jgi:hypothetical protein